MRHALLALVLVLSPAAAGAQVSTDSGALDQLKPTAPAPAARPAPKPRVRAKTTHAAPAKPARPATTAVKRTPPPPLPAAPPANPVIAPPPFVMPAHPPPPPPPVPVKPDAAGAASTQPGGLTRITFGAGSADLNPATAAAIRAVATAALAHPAQVITIDAWAAGTNDDPSTPRRISLDRALAARAVLINAGVVSERIHAVAKGFSEPGQGPIDRVDIGVK